MYIYKGRTLRPRGDLNEKCDFCNKLINTFLHNIRDSKGNYKYICSDCLDKIRDKIQYK